MNNILKVNMDQCLSFGMVSFYKNLNMIINLKQILSYIITY
jgi:hypothetical protein